MTTYPAPRMPIQLSGLDDRLLVAAYDSYLKHCTPISRAIEFAEKDLLGEALGFAIEQQHVLLREQTP